MFDPVHVSSVLARLVALSLAKLTSEIAVLGALLFQPSSSFSVFSLFSALGIAVLFVMARRKARGRRMNLRLIPRALFPRWLVRSASTKADVGFFLLNIYAVGGLIGWGLISFAAVSHWTQAALVGALGQRPPSELNPHLTQAILTLVLFLVYEFAYWVDHYLSHEVPFLWEFHRVHHTAETLTPLTVFRVHPVDTLKFYNILALFTGAAGGIGGYLIGGPVVGIHVSGPNIILMGFVFVTLHLQHSHVWIAFTGGWGRIFASPAHHQIHHSADPAHFGKNLGSCLALWDWVFGTLRIPTKAREPLVYGVEPDAVGPHTIAGGLVTPFVRALATLRPSSARPTVAAASIGLVDGASSPGGR